MYIRGFGDLVAGLIKGETYWKLFVSLIGILLLLLTFLSIIRPPSITFDDHRYAAYFLATLCVCIGVITYKTKYAYRWHRPVVHGQKAETIGKRMIVFGTIIFIMTFLYYFGK